MALSVVKELRFIHFRRLNLHQRRFAFGGRESFMVMPFRDGKRHANQYTASGLEKAIETLQNATGQEREIELLICATICPHLNKHLRASYHRSIITD